MADKLLDICDELARGREFVHAAYLAVNSNLLDREAADALSACANRGREFTGASEGEARKGLDRCRRPVMRYNRNRQRTSTPGSR
jgi:hypothetical protein